MKLSCLKWSGVHLSKGVGTKSPAPPKSGHAPVGQDAKAKVPAKAKGRATADMKSAGRSR